jgi:hypothetical protein
MLILRQKMRAKPDKSDELMAALAEIIAPARATEGVISLDIARVLLDPIHSSRPWFMRTVLLSNDRSHARRCTR